MQGGGVAVYGSANFVDCALYDNVAYFVHPRIRNFWTLLPAPRWNVTRLIAYFCMQGGGVGVLGTANFQNCQIYDNEALSVRAAF